MSFFFSNWTFVCNTRGRQINNMEHIFIIYWFSDLLIIDCATHLNVLFYMTLIIINTYSLNMTYLWQLPFLHSFNVFPLGHTTLGSRQLDFKWYSFPSCDQNINNLYYRTGIWEITFFLLGQFVPLVQQWKKSSFRNRTK